MYNPLTALLLGLGFMAMLSLLFWPKGGLIGYLRRAKQLSSRIQQEDALKHIHKAERHGQPPTLESLAGALQISTSKAARLLGDMQASDLVELKGGTFHLTPSGREYALQIIRAHRLFERYLSEKTGFEELEWHDIAERHEHHISLTEAEKLSAQLGNPTHDPHGDPIPTAEGKFVLHGGEPLTNMLVDTPLRIVHIEDEPEAVYAQLVAEGLYVGMEVRIIEATTQRIKFWANGDEHLLAPIVAASVSVVPLPEEILEPGQTGEPLNSLNPGERGEVITLSPLFRGQERRRMMDLGILPGTVIVAEMDGPSGDPTAYRIRGALIALREEQARLIRINRLQEALQ
jgi:DtxR family Mn-dependent transcriptional regulator